MIDDATEHINYRPLRGHKYQLTTAAYVAVPWLEGYEFYAANRLVAVTRHCAPACYLKACAHRSTICFWPC